MPAPPAWHALEAAEVLQRIGGTEAGLTGAAAVRRLAQHGRNELHDRRPVRPLAILVAQFRSLLVALLLVAGVAAWLLGDWIDGVAILAIMVLNAGIGFVQELGAERSLATLRRLTAPAAKVRRDGRVLTLPAAEIVPGDVVLLEAGDLVPADLRLLSAASLRCIEAALTGESAPVDKDPGAVLLPQTPLGDRRNLAFLGTSVAAGSGAGVVVATGMGSEFGRIAALLATGSGEEPTPLQRRLDALGRGLVLATLAIVALLLLLGLLRGLPAGAMFLTAVSLAVAAVPEGLAAVVTIALAVGVRRMARRRVLIRRLPAVETLGSADVICTDKTGTLTAGEMTVRALYDGSRRHLVTGEGYAPDGAVLAEDHGDAAQARELLATFAGCCDAYLDRGPDGWRVIGDPTEGALLAAAAKAGVHRDDIERGMPRRAEWPFDATRKRMSVARDVGGGRLRLLVKGAPESVLARCTGIATEQGARRITAADRERIEAEQRRLAGHALRVLAAAFRDLAAEAPAGADPDRVERELTFVGLAGMYDPPRPQAQDAIARCRAAGIRVVMITGDHPSTARAIAAELGLRGDERSLLAGPELDRMSDAELAARASGIAVYARVTAEHKLRIVRAWQANGSVVAMTGDGVNDAPAVQGADIGIAMGRTGTEVTKEASAMIVTDDDFASIVAAVEEGRGIYDNVRKTLQYLLAGNAGELLLMTACIAGGLPVPLLPIHLLWINLVTDGLPALALATDPIEEDVMQRPPRPRTERLADARFLGPMLLAGTLTAGVALAVYLWGLAHEDEAGARTHAFAALVFAELFRSFSVRSETRPIWRLGLFGNAKLAAVVFATIAFQIASHHFAPLRAFFQTTELTWTECALLLAVGLVPLVLLEANKLRDARRRPSGA